MRGLFAGTFVVKVDSCFAQEELLDRLKNRGPDSLCLGGCRALPRLRIRSNDRFFALGLSSTSIVRSFRFVIESNNAIWGFVLDDTRDRSRVCCKRASRTFLGRARYAQ